MGAPVKERIAAKEAGERHYETGKPCQNGHIAKRYTANGECVVCSAAKHARWLAERPGLEAEWARKARAKDPTGHRAASKRWAEKNPEKVTEIAKRAYYKDIERRRAMNRGYMEKWCAANQEAHNAHRRNSYHRDIAKSRQQAVAHAATRRARMIGNGGSFTRDDIQLLTTLQKGKCAECRCKLSDTHVDHIIPLVLGGTNDPSNLQLLCPTCNMQKGKLDPIAWAKKRGRLL